MMYVLFYRPDWGPATSLREWYPMGETACLYPINWSYPVASLVLGRLILWGSVPER